MIANLVVIEGWFLPEARAHALGEVVDGDHAHQAVQRRDDQQSDVRQHWSPCLHLILSKQKSKVIRIYKISCVS